ncbi:MAG: hypothetical protein AAFR38_11930 [Planctomycetota bacterium]
MRIDVLDERISAAMRRHGVDALRYALALIFIWFGLLKPLGLSPAAPLVLQTVDWMPVFSAQTWLAIIGWWEVAIGACFFFRPALRIAIGLLALQMAGTFMPLVILPSVTFQEGRFPYALTMEGQYIVKNLLIIAAAMVVGGTVRPAHAKPSARHARTRAHAV